MPTSSNPTSPAGESPRGRGASSNPTNRFETITLERDADWNPEDDPAPRTVFLRDLSQTIIATNDSPDIPFTASVNPYRGCEHGCIYCYARPTHEYLGFSAGLDFETRIMVKLDAPKLLREALASPKWQPQCVAMSGVTDCYQPAERRFRLTRGCLEVFAEFRNPVGIVTKNHLVTRDIDVLSELARHHAVAVYVTITSLDADLVTRLEPRAALPSLRLKTVAQLAEAGIPVGVMVAPIIPAITDHEVPAILDAARKAGAREAAFVVLRLPYGVKDLFERWVEQNFPDRKDKVLNRIRSLRDGQLNDPRFGSRMLGEGIFAEQIAAMFRVAKRKAGFDAVSIPELSTTSFRNPHERQLKLL